MVIKLYKADTSAPSRAVLITLELLKLKYESIYVRPLHKEHLKPEFVALNPEHTVPFIEDGNFKLGDSHAIMIYLLTKYGGEQKEKLYPSDEETRAIVNHRLFFDAATTFPRLFNLVMEKVRGENPVVKARLITEIKDVYGILEKYLGKNEFFAANHLTIADISIVSNISSLEPLVPLDGYLKLTAWLEKLKKYDWYKKANAPGVEMLTDFMSE